MSREIFLINIIRLFTKNSEGLYDIFLRDFKQDLVFVKAVPEQQLARASYDLTLTEAKRYGKEIGVRVVDKVTKQDLEKKVLD